MSECEECGGTGIVSVVVVECDDGCCWDEYNDDCPDCDGTGTTNARQ